MDAACSGLLLFLDQTASSHLSHLTRQAGGEGGGKGIVTEARGGIYLLPQACGFSGGMKYTQLKRI